MAQVDKDLEELSKKTTSILKYVEEKNIETLDKKHITDLQSKINAAILKSYSPEDGETSDESEKKTKKVLSDLNITYNKLIYFCEQVIPDFDEKNIKEGLANREVVAAPDKNRESLTRKGQPKDLKESMSQEEFYSRHNKLMKDLDEFGNFFKNMTQKILKENSKEQDLIKKKADALLKATNGSKQKAIEACDKAIKNIDIDFGNSKHKDEILSNYKKVKAYLSGQQEVPVKADLKTFSVNEEKINQSDYKYYVCQIFDDGTLNIIEGNEYEEDAKDVKKEMLSYIHDITIKILSKRYLSSKGVNPDEDKYWSDPKPEDKSGKAKLKVKEEFQDNTAPEKTHWQDVELGSELNENKKIMSEKKKVILYSELTPIKLTPHTLSESTTHKEGRMIFPAILQRINAKNENGRIYPEPTMRREIGKYIASNIAEKRAFGELDHSDRQVVEFKNACLHINEIWWKGDEVWGQIEVLDTPSGKIIQEILKKGFSVGISSRGLGSVSDIDENTVEVDDDYVLICWDAVTNPSTHGAFLQTGAGDSFLKESTEKESGVDKIDEVIADILCQNLGYCACKLKV